jgi:hypothetical protein
MQHHTARRVVDARRAARRETYGAAPAGRRPSRGTTLSALLVLVLASFSAIAVRPAEAAAAVRVSCNALPGSGSYSDPLRLGTISGTVIAVGCPPLTSGAPFNRRYFSFSTTRTAGQNSVAGSRFTLTREASSAVHPRLSSGPWTVMRSSDGFWTGTSPNFTGRYLPLAGLRAGAYRLGVEKLRSPLSSLSTPSFDVIVIIR